MDQMVVASTVEEEEGSSFLALLQLQPWKEKC